MNIPKRLLGSLVELHWKDPNSARGSIETAKRGREALATWKEVGWIHDITDGVVLLVHSYAASPGDPIEKPDEMERTAIHEDFIEKVIVYVAAPQTTG
jgi:hypothetical protein